MLASIPNNQRRAARWVSEYVRYRLYTCLLAVVEGIILFIDPPPTDSPLGEKYYACVVAWVMRG